METAAKFRAPALHDLLRRISAEVRCRRAEYGAWRGAFWGAAAVAAIFAMKGWLGSAALPVALLAAVVVVATWAIVGACRRVPPLAAARLADRAFDLQDRVTTALECSLQEPAAPLARALLADAVSRAGEIQKRPRWRRIVQRRLPWEARFLALPTLAAAALALAPPLPAPHAPVQELAPGQEERSPVSFLDRVKNVGRNLPGSQPPVPQEAFQQKPGNAQEPSEAAQFKDRTIDKRRADFSSFAKSGDERLRLLDRSDRLPDLQSDFASSGYRMLMRKTRELTAGGGPGSAAKLGQILHEMERLGKEGGGDWSDEASEGLEALQEGLTEEAMSAMQNALGKMRSAEERQRAGKLLKQGPAGEAQDEEGGRPAAGSGSLGDQDGQRGYSLSRGGASKGAPTARLRSTPYDTGVEGLRSGRMPGYETQMRSRAASGSMQLQFMGEIGQYRRQMEDALAREQVPREYRQQIRNYFNSLNEQ